MKRMPKSDTRAMTPDHRHRQGRHEDVVVLDVAQLVGQHALELDPVHLLQQPGGDGDGGVLGVAPGGEGVRGGVVDDVDAGLRQPAGDAEPLDQVVQPGVLAAGRPGLARLMRSATASDFQ